MSNMLVIDTSEAAAFVEAWENDRLLARLEFGTANHAQGLVKHLKQLLADVQWTPSIIEAIAVNIGPGSFTGIRVGLATAKAMVYVGGQKLIGVDAFDAWAAGLPSRVNGTVFVVTAGQLQTANIVSFVSNANNWQRESLRTVPRTDLVRELQSKQVIGPAGSLRKELNPHCDWIDVQPRVDIVARRRLVEYRFDNPISLEPFYVRPSSAEEKWDARRTNA